MLGCTNKIKNMRQFIFILGLLLTVSFSVAQEVILDDSEIIMKEDSSWEIRRVLIVSSSETRNDTSITYTQIPDSATAVSQIYRQGYNEAQRLLRPYLEGFASRRIISYLKTLDTYLSQLTGVGYFDRLAESQEAYYTGTWRIVYDTVDIRVEIVPHPALTGFYRANNINGPGSWNVKPYIAEKFFAILNFEGETRWMMLNNTSANPRPVYMSSNAVLPQVLGGGATFTKAVKLE